MIDSTVGLVGEVREGAAGPVEVVVEPDAGGEGEEFGGDAGSEAVEGAGVVAFEPESVFEGPEDRLDVLADRGEVRTVSGFVFAGGSEDQRAVLVGDGGGEFAADVPLVGDDYFASVQADWEQSERDLAFFLVSGGEDRRSGGAVRGGEQVQAHAPEPAGMAAAVPVPAGVGELGSPGGLDRATALHRDGIQQHYPVVVAGA